MRLISLQATLLIASCASAYENTSPFYLYSTANFDIPPIGDLSLASSVETIISKPLSQCPTKNYIIASQPGVSASDLTNAGISLPGEDNQSQNIKEQTTTTVRDVIGTIDTLAIDDSFRSACDIQSVHILDVDLIPELDNKNKSNTLVHINFPALHDDLTMKERHAVLHQHNLYLSVVIHNYFGGEDYTVIYTTSSRETARNAQTTPGKEYIMGDDVSSNMMHQDLKRDLLGASLAKRKSSSSSNQTIVDGPLFDKYQFLSPGIFMGGLVFLILLMILYVGFAALLSLQVTYGAFDKEQGQLAGKKQ